MEYPYCSKKVPDPVVRKCSDCVHSFLKDTGYSDLTVDGISVSCLIKKHPCETFDDDSKDNDFAMNCPYFKQGNIIHLSVEDPDPFEEIM